MLIARLVVGLLLLAAILCFGVAIATGQPVWRQRGIVILKWTMLAGLGFFGVLFRERLVVML
ncbi:hypothetical protein [Aquariibacter albus]|uniref:Uncharacterized protein n=1 Tax=Aquariibacter albus TaxID=2759899 RepID=A0A839HJ20_9BURK|nr:hypothetical protein [Aquariibacter albus]MBB1162647.1 hypothetical protein [Aquariibacter albus]